MGSISQLPTQSADLIQHDEPRLSPFHDEHPNIYVLTHSSPDYASLHQEYNLYNTVVPLAIVFPADIDELAAIVRYCVGQSPPVTMTIRGGGHDAYGRNALASAIQLDLRLMSWTKILAHGTNGGELGGYSIASVGPGTTAIEMQRALSSFGLAAPTGWVGSVGVTGWACGGGYGMEAGAWGLGLDNILGAQIVSSTGDLIDTDDDPELLWAIRGAGLGNFGVICELRLKTYPNPRYLAGFVAFPLSEGEKVLGGLQELDHGQGLPRNFSGEFVVNTTSLGPTINILFAWISEKTEHITQGWTYLERLKGLGSVLLDTVSETSILKHHELIHANPDFNARGYTTLYSLAIPRLSTELIRIIANHPPPEGGTSCILFHHAHGRALQADPTAAWSHRSEHYICTPCGFSSPDASPQQRARSKQWADDIFSRIQETGLSLDKGYWSMTPPAYCDANRFFGNDTVRRLRKLKNKYNPENAFPAALPVLE